MISHQYDGLPPALNGAILVGVGFAFSGDLGSNHRAKVECRDNFW
jgi:hypothetical protein